MLTLMLCSCATDATRAYDQARYEANPNYQDDANKNTSYEDSMPRDAAQDAKAAGKRASLFACLLRYSAYFNAADSRWICD